MLREMLKITLTLICLNFSFVWATTVNSISMPEAILASDVIFTGKVLSANIYDKNATIINESGASTGYGKGNYIVLTVYPYRERSLKGKGLLVSTELNIKLHSGMVRYIAQVREEFVGTERMFLLRKREQLMPVHPQFIYEGLGQYQKIKTTLESLSEVKVKFYYHDNLYIKIFTRHGSIYRNENGEWYRSVKSDLQNYIPYKPSKESVKNINALILKAISIHNVNLGAYSKAGNEYVSIQFGRGNELHMVLNTNAKKNMYIKEKIIEGIERLFR